MRKNGFTLIELLAVIVILAIIALIATPIILGIINDAREKANERSVELYASAVRNAVAAYQLTGTTAPKSFNDLTIQYDGEVECAIEELYADGSFYLDECRVNKTEVDYTTGKKCGIISGDATNVGDEISCVGEHFYVINNESNNIEMLAKYNLDVGYYDSDEAQNIKIDNVDGNQQKGVNKEYIYYAYVDFASQGYWVDDNTLEYLVDVNYASEGREYPYVYGNYEYNTIYPYVENYVKYLKNKGLSNSISGKLLSYEQAINIKNNFGNPDWLYTTNYYLGSGTVLGGGNGIFCGFSGGYIGDSYFYGIDSGYSGVRPVITISTSELG